MTEPREFNTQGGIPLAESNDDKAEVAHGSRGEEVHFEPDADHVATARFTETPAAALPPQMHSAEQERGEGESDPAVEDVRVVPGDASVWDARPADDDDGFRGISAPT
ncbi:hypothetical protein [Phenylobacterium sp.]|jgi:hypothetical protein|uniref:hypothetical protein n=1 Tax=Phenylobacterium sp. TaxID=1871053 RepID=UPI002F95A521